MLDKKGLSSKEAEIKLKRYGLNILPEKPPPSSLVLFLSQLKNPLVYVLLAAGFVTLFLGDFSDTVIIFFVVAINSTLGFVQEQRASHALESLKALIRPTANVIRDGKETKIDIREIVLGDIVEIQQGDKIPADGRLTHVNRLFLEEAVLTGESMPVEKLAETEIYMGTIVSSGEGLMEVTGTGANTEMGKIAISVQKPHEDTPLTRQLKIFSSQLTVLVIVLTSLVFLIGFATGRGFVEMFKTSVALAVSSIPEGLLIALTAVLAVGMQRVLKKRGLVRNLISAETLGGVTTICVDKTGTLTYGKLKVVEIFGNRQELCRQHFASSKDPMMIAAKGWLKDKSKHFDESNENLHKDCGVLDSIPFTSQNRFYATLIKHREKTIYISGAPEHLLEWSTLAKNEIEKIKEKIKVLTREGNRVIGMARKDVSNKVVKISEDDVKSDLRWVGLLVYTDAVRKGVSDAFKQTEEAGIKTILITGDYAETAIAVLNQLNMRVSQRRIIVGQDLEKMSDEEVSERLKSLHRGGGGVIVFARTKPEQKLKVINALKLNGEVVAMMGDGVNDAPALHRADIGIVVGNATDVAKESADLILLDSSFETIVATIREGRGIFDNIRKIILYLLSDSFEEIVVVVGTIVLSLPLPVTAIQILWINIVSDGFPHLSLTVDPKTKDIMKRYPRRPGTLLVSGWMKTLIFIVSLSGGLVALILFSYYFKLTGNIAVARSITFATLGVNSLVYVFSIRTLTQPFWDENPFGNKWLNIAVLAGFTFQILPFASQSLRNFFGLESLTFLQWTSVITASFVMFVIVEVSKIIFRVRFATEDINILYPD